MNELSQSALLGYILKQLGTTSITVARTCGVLQACGVVLKKKAIGHLTSKPVVACDVAMCARARTETHWAELYYSSRCYFDITSLRNSKSE